jgi:hypothetical protein
MQFSLSGKKTNILFKTLAISLEDDVTIEQTPEKLLFSDGKYVYGEFDRDFFDEYTVDSFNKVLIDSLYFSRLFNAGQTKKIDQYHFHFPHEEVLKKEIYKFYVERIVSKRLKGEMGLRATVSDKSLEKPFSFKGQFPILKNTNIPLTTCLIISKKSKNLFSALGCKKNHFNEISITIDDSLTMEKIFGDSTNFFDVVIKNNPHTFTNKYSSHDLSLIMNLPTHPTIYTAPNCSLLCINNFVDYRIAIIISIINQEQKVVK